MQHAGIRVLLALFAAALLAAGSAAADELSGTAGLQARSTSGRTVFLAGTAYRVTDATVLRDANGETLALADLDVPDLDPGDEPPPLAPVMARFEAVRRGDDLVLVSLDLLSRPD